MRSEIWGGAVALAASVLLVPAASAAISVGQVPAMPSQVSAPPACNTGTWAVTSTAVPPRYEIPGDGVITSWRTYTGATFNQGPVRLKIVRPVSATSFEVVAASAYITPVYNVDGANGPFTTRIPVVANDLIALGVGPRTGTQTMPACQFSNSLAAGSMAKIGADDPPDEAAVLTWGASPHPTFRVSVSASLEPDLDRDGFGDETQDRCPAAAGPNDGCPPATGPTGPAKVESMSISRHRFRAARSGPSVRPASRHSGTKVTYTLDQAARTRFTVVKLRPGRKVHGHCVSPRHANRTKRACIRAATLHRSFTLEGQPGANAFRFTGRLAHKRLAPGTYKLVATPTANGLAGHAASARFRIVA